jgi:uroporphyrinogen decarboxylase
LHALLESLADMTADYLAMQIESGADAVQLFESTPDVLSRAEYESFAHPYQARVFSKLAATVPTILFVKEFSDVNLMAESGADVLSIGAGVDLASAIERVGDRVALQGNIDNRLLVDGPSSRIEAAVRECVRVGGSRGHILNLGHGLLKETPFEHVRLLIDTCKATCVDASADVVEAG